MNFDYNIYYVLVAKFLVFDQEIYLIQYFGLVHTNEKHCVSTCFNSYQPRVGAGGPSVVVPFQIIEVL